MTKHDREIVAVPSIEYISMVRKEMSIGEFKLLAFMDAKNQYYINVTQLGKLIDKRAEIVISYLASLSDLTNPMGSGVTGFATHKQVERSILKGFPQTPSESSLPIFHVMVGNAKYRVIPIDTVSDFLWHWMEKGNLKAKDIVKAFSKESLKVRCESAFVGVSPNVVDIIDGTNHWLASREMSKSVQGAFQEFCMSKKLQAGNVHNRMTMHLFGQTKRMAIKNNQLVGEDPTIGLDHQDSIEGQLAIAKMKVKFMSYRKGTWQERVDRCFTESI